LYGISEKNSIIEDMECKDWTLYCTQSFNRNYHGEGSGIEDLCGVYNAVTCELKNTDGEREVRTCLVLAIIYLEIHTPEEEEENLTTTFLCVSPLQEADKVGFLPYDYQILCSSEVVDCIDIEVVVAKNKLISPVFVVPCLGETLLDYDLHLHEVDFSTLTYITIPMDRMTFPALHLSSVEDVRSLSPNIFVSENFLIREQTRLKIDYDHAIGMSDVDESINEDDLIVDQDSDEDDIVI
jgi:hypothetical protein